jgi:hypothetical protein
VNCKACNLASCGGCFMVAMIVGFCDDDVILK